MKKRILQLIGSFHQGGSERQAVGLTRLLKDHGKYDVFAATLNKDGILLADVEAIGLPEIPEFRLTSFFNTNFIRQVRLCSMYLKENRIDLVHTHDFYTNVFGMAAARLAGTKARVASKRETGGMRSAIQEAVERLAFGRAHAVVVNSKFVRSFLEARGIPKTKTRLIYNGLDLDRFENVSSDRITVFLKKNRLSHDSGNRLVTLVANLRHEVKNVPMLLRAAVKIVDADPKAHFILAGEGKLESKLREIARSLGIAENVHFIGRCTEIPELLSASYACVLTSTAEGFSNSIIEYMAAGKPVVATDVGGANEAIGDGVSGFLVDSDDHAALAQKLITLLADEEKAAAFGREGNRIVKENFTERVQLQNTLQLYNSLLS